MKKTFTEQEVLKLLQIQNQENFIYLDQLVDASDEKNTTTVQEFIADPSPTPDQIYEEKDLHNTLMKYIGKLSPREQIVTVMYYGLNGEEPKTLDAVGKVFGVSRERIRQILNKSQKKLKRYFEIDNIHNYSDFN